MKRLLMATDLSARSDRALERAVKLAREREAELVVVHVVDDDLPASLADAQAQAAEETLRQHIAELAGGEAAGVTVKILFGKAYFRVLELSEEVDAEMIVLGMHREDALKDMFRGTTAERVIRAGNLPVLLVKDRPTGAYEHAMVGVDFSVYSRRAVEFAVKFVPQGRFTLVHAYDVPFKAFLHGHGMRHEISKSHEAQFQAMVEEEMATFFASLESKPPKLERVMQEGMVDEVLHRQLKKLKPDLLVIGTHGRTGAAHALLGSIAEDLLRAPPCDVLAVKAW